MILFFSLAVLLVVVALAILLPVLFRAHEVLTGVRSDRNITIARERLAEIESDLAREIISDDNYSTLREEIELNLVDDLTVDSTTTAISRGGQWAAVVIAFVLPVLTGGIYLVIGTPSAVSLPPGIVASATGGGLPAQDDIPGMISSLAGRLQQSPDDAEGWALLGRSYMTTGQYGLAVEAYDRLLSLAGDHPLILLMLADALAMSEEGRVSDQAADLIQRAIILDPENLQGLWMSGIAAIQRGEPARAITYWETLEPMLSDAPQQLAEITALIRSARGVEGKPVVDSGPRPAADSEDSAGADVAGVTVNVDIGAEFRDRVSPTDTVFVYARAATGPPMPLAVKRITVADLPTEVMLNDTDAMTPAMSLSQFDRVIVGARVSSSGNAIAEPGDIQGLSGEILSAQSETVDILMDHVVE